MAYVVLSKELGVDLVDKDGVVTKQNVIVGQGQKLPGNVSPFLINALKSGGVIAFVEDGPIAMPVLRDLEPPMQVRTPDQPPLLPSDPVGNRVLAGEVPPGEAKPMAAQVELGNLDPQDTLGLVPGAVVGGTSPQQPAGTVLEKPKAADNKEAWEAYAVQVGIDEGEAQSMTKTDLRAEVEKREQAQS